MSPIPSSRLARNLSLSLALATLFMIFAGSMVSTMKAGDSVPDWPLSYGQVVPPMRGLVFFEHGHRMVGWLVGFLSIGLCAVLYSRPGETRLRRLSLLLLALVIFQGGLGGLRVLLVQKAPFSQAETWRAAFAIAHAVTAQVFFCMAAWTAFVARRSEFPPVSPAPRHGALASGALVIQILLGIVARQLGWGLMAHAAWGLASVAAVSFFASRLAGLSSGDFYQRGGLFLAGLIIAQAGLGLASLAYRLNSPTAGGLSGALVKSAHGALGALVLGTTLTLVLGMREDSRG